MNVLDKLRDWNLEREMKAPVKKRLKSLHKQEAKGLKNLRKLSATIAEATQKENDQEAKLAEIKDRLKGLEAKLDD